MRYVLLIHSGDEVRGRFNSLDDAGQQAILDECSVLTEAPGVQDSAHLHPADTATTVRVKDGRTLTTDGPFIEAKEALGGYFAYEGKDLDAAIELAARIPAARMGGRDRDPPGRGGIERRSTRYSVTSGAESSPPWSASSALRKLWRKRWSERLFPTNASS